jgi:hypothetical protein
MDGGMKRAEHEKKGRSSAEYTLTAKPGPALGEGMNDLY